MTEYEDKMMDRQIMHQKSIDYCEHGSTYGLQKSYYFCEKCQLGWSSLPPFHVVHFKQNGLHYAIPRPIRDTMPACPECRERDHVHKLNRYKKRSD